MRQASSRGTGKQQGCGPRCGPPARAYFPLVQFVPPIAPARRSSTTALRPPAHAAPQPARHMGHGATPPGATDGRGTQEGRERHERRQRHETHERPPARGRDAAPPYAKRQRGPARGCSSLAQLWAWLLPVSAVFAAYHPCRPTVRPPPLRRGPPHMPRPSHLRGARYPIGGVAPAAIEGVGQIWHHKESASESRTACGRA